MYGRRHVSIGDENSVAIATIAPLIDDKALFHTFFSSAPHWKQVLFDVNWYHAPCLLEPRPGGSTYAPGIVVGKYMNTGNIPQATRLYVLRLGLWDIVALCDFLPLLCPVFI